MINYKEISFCELAERKAETEPDHILLYQGDKPYTWKEINACADCLAGELSRTGVKRGTHVGIYGSNSANWIICFFAIQKLGAIGVLLNPALQTGELISHLRISDITHLCFGESSAFNRAKDAEHFISEIRSGEGCGEVIFVNIGNLRDFREENFGAEKFGTERFGEGLSGAERDDRFFRPEPDDPALMLFTSGSTGTPKCVLLSAYNVLISSYESRESQQLKAEDRACLILPLFHIFGLVAGLFAHILADAAIYLPEDIHAATLIKTIQEEQCTVFHAVPTMMLMMLGSQAFAPEKLSTLRCTILSGAAATGEQIERFQRALPNNHFLSSYGLSEAAPVSILPYGDILENCIRTVGKPMPHIRLKIQDIETGRECAACETGEIVVRGDNLMTGYYRVQAEDQAIDGDGWLHTGDLGYLREDGYLCLSGRQKELIIRGGENIIPREVAEAVSSIPEIEDVRVVGVPSDFYGEEVCACIRLAKGTIFDETAAREYLKNRLARFKLPSFFVVYDEFPVLGTGKADMAALKWDAEKRCKGK